MVLEAGLLSVKAPQKQPGNNDMPCTQNRPKQGELEREAVRAHHDTLASNSLGSPTIIADEAATTQEGPTSIVAANSCFVALSREITMPLTQAMPAISAPGIALVPGSPAYPATSAMHAPPIQLGDASLSSTEAVRRLTKFADKVKRERPLPLITSPPKQKSPDRNARVRCEAGKSQRSLWCTSQCPREEKRSS